MIIGLDAPYTSEKQQGLDRLLDDIQDELASIREEEPSLRAPLLICCGPTEQHEDFQDALTGYVQVESAELPHETATEIGSLREWYRARSGAENLPVESSDDVLMVQLFFEWRTGEPIAAFAQRFRKRLLDFMDGETALFDLIATILALNRLYALYSANAVDAALRDNPALEGAYKQLRDDDRHLMNVTDDLSSGGLRLTHPHLANAIYTACFGSKRDIGFRRKHLRDGFAASMDHEEHPSARFAPLWSVVRLLRHRGDAIADGRLTLIDTELKEACRDLYTSRHHAIQAPLSELPVWVDIERRLALALHPAPLDAIAAAVADAQNDEPGLRLSCHKLLEVGGAPGALTVKSLLGRLPDWQQWGAVAHDYLRRLDGEPIGEQLVSFVQHRGHSMDARRLVKLCVDRPELAADIRGTLLETWLSTNPTVDPMWVALLTDTIEKFGLSVSLRALGERFLIDRTFDRSWSHVWERLWQRLDHDPDAIGNLVDLAHNWLWTATAPTTGWSFIWEALWKAAGENDDTLAEIARQWLKDAPPDHGSWAFVWQPLWKAAGENDDTLAEIARQWLGDAPPDHTGWISMWRVLLKAAGENNEALCEVGRGWLRTAAPELSSWGLVWYITWKNTGECDASLAKLAFDCVRAKRLNDKSWAFAALGLLKTDFGQSLSDDIILWLMEHKPQTNGWLQLWHATFDHYEICRERLAAVSANTARTRTDGRVIPSIAIKLEANGFSTSAGE